MSSRSSSLALQRHISNSSIENVRLIGSYFQNHYHEMATHQFASYILQVMVSKDSGTAESLGNFCEAHFKELMLNQYSSRIIQKLIENSFEFYKRARSILTEYFDLALTQTSSVFLVIACVTKAGNSSECDFIMEKLKDQPNLIRLRAFQKILLVYIQRCNASRCDQVYESMLEAISLDHLLKDRYSTYALLAIVQKADALLIEEFLLQLVKEKIFMKKPSFFPNLLLGLA